MKISVGSPQCLPWQNHNCHHRTENKINMESSWPRRSAGTVTMMASSSGWWPRCVRKTSWSSDRKCELLMINYRLVVCRSHGLCVFLLGRDIFPNHLQAWGLPNTAGAPNCSCTVKKKISCLKLYILHLIPIIHLPASGFKKKEVLHWWWWSEETTTVCNHFLSVSDIHNNSGGRKYLDTSFMRLCCSALL